MQAVNMSRVKGVVLSQQTVKSLLAGVKSTVWPSK